MWPALLGLKQPDRQYQQAHQCHPTGNCVVTQTWFLQVEQGMAGEGPDARGPG